MTENIGNQTIILNQNEAGVRIVYEQQVAEVPEMKSISEGGLGLAEVLDYIGVKKE